MKLRVGDVIEDRRYPSSRYIGVVTEVWERVAYVTHMQYEIGSNKVMDFRVDSAIDPREEGIILLTPAPGSVVPISPGPMASTVDKCTPRCEYQYGESSYGAGDGLPCGLPATKQVGEFSACAKHERQMEEV